MAHAHRLTTEDADLLRRDDGALRKVLPAWLEETFPRTSPPANQVGALIGRGQEGYVYRYGRTSIVKYFFASPAAVIRLALILDWFRAAELPEVVPIEASGLIGELELPTGAPFAAFHYIAKRMERPATYVQSEAIARALQKRGIRLDDGLSPDNVMLDGEGNPRLVDLGLFTRPPGVQKQISGFAGLV